ncbi:unnamed protein product [Linum tenue]|uniref:Uncharacterized protein n=1 Tax=Linum tenue TaxID=586396 RepID=A0AAV0NF27_9ROSI|nr:unnamed protein product [Linum tenue]
MRRGGEKLTYQTMLPVSNAFVFELCKDTEPSTHDIRLDVDQMILLCNTKEICLGAFPRHYEEHKKKRRRFQRRKVPTGENSADRERNILLRYLSKTFALVVS